MSGEASRITAEEVIVWAQAPDVFDALVGTEGSDEEILSTWEGVSQSRVQSVRDAYNGALESKQVDAESQIQTAEADLQSISDIKLKIEQATVPGAVPVEEFQFFVSAYNRLKRNGWHTAGDVAKLSEKELLDPPLGNMNPAWVEEIKAGLARVGLSLREDDRPSPESNDPNNGYDIGGGYLDTALEYTR